jgi:hypothetical protein
MSSHRGVVFVHRVAAGYQRDQAPWPDHVHGLREKVIVNGACQVRTSAVYRVIDRIIAERDISNSRVKEVLRNRGFFEALCMNARIRVEFGGDARGDRVELHTGASRTGMQTFGHHAKEVTDTHRRFENLRARI